jgi:hypothetical protein
MSLQATYPCRVSNETRAAGDLLVRIGAVVFAVGAVGTLVTLTPLLLGTHPLPLAAYLVSMLMGVGLACALAGLLRQALAHRPPRSATSPPAASPSASRDSAAS